jgi:hypothetical protein
MRAIYILFVLTFALQAQADYGMEEWVYIKDLPDDGISQAIDIEVDEQGYVYVAGDRAPQVSFSLLDFSTIKLDSDGNEIWSAVYDGPGHDIDQAINVDVDADGYVYVTGRSYGAGTLDDICTIKYDPNGNEVWVRRYDGPANGTDQGAAIEVNDAGEVIVGGMVESAGTDWDSIVIKYDADGNEIWTAVYDGPAGGEDDISGKNGMVIDEQGNIYVTGKSEGIGTEYEFCTIKYNPDGGEEWVTRYDGPVSGFYDDPQAGIALDSDGNVFVSGCCAEPPYYTADYYTIKYDNDGNELWVVSYGEPSQADLPYDIAVDENGNACVTGILSPFIESCTVKYDTDGNEIWAAQGDLYYSVSTAVDEYGAVYCCGLTDSQDPDGDAGVVKYACETGDTQWVAEYDGPEGVFDAVQAITIDSQGNIFVGGVCNAQDTGRWPGVLSSDLLGDTVVPALHNVKYNKRDMCFYGRGCMCGDTLVMKYSRTVSVELLRFAALPQNERITLEWEISATEDETIEGFNLYRREIKKPETKTVTKADGPTKVVSDDWTKINGALITGANPYSYVDEDAGSGVTYEYKLEAFINTKAETLGTTTATTGVGIPTSYALYQSRPNPTTGTAIIAFDLPEETPVTLTVYDISGRKVTTLVNETLAAGEHGAEVSELAPGVYVYRLDTSNYSASKKMVVVR